MSREYLAPVQPARMVSEVETNPDDSFMGVSWRYYNFVVVGI